MTGDTNVLWRRAVAHVLDNIVPLLTAFAATAATESAAVFWILLIGGWVGQTIVLQGLTGSTPGKWVARIRTVDAEGCPAGITAMIKRTIPLLFEWFGLIAIFAIHFSAHGQRFGDRWAGTYVIRARRGELGRPLGLAT
jgi:uncharacterized RDD family membrane protein YckC